MQISDLKSDLQRKIGGTSLNKVSGVYSLIAEAGRSVLTQIDPEETIRITQITNAVHDEVYDYAIPSDFKDVIDLRPQADRKVGDNFSKGFSEAFDLRKYLVKERLAIRNNSGTKSIRIAASLSSPTTLHQMNSITENGTWAVGDNATNLTVDTVDYISGSGSLNFDLTAGGATGYIENSAMTAVDLTDHDEKSSLFLWVYIPDTSIITNFILRWGSSSANYWLRTVTQAHDATAFRTGWNLLRFDWNGATETGTVNPASIGYLRLTTTYNGTAETDLRVDNIVSSLGKIYEIEYYSKYIFRNSSGTWLETPTADSDTINLDVEGYNCLLYECVRLLAPEIMEEDAGFDSNFYERELHGSGTKKGLYQKYREHYPSQRMRPQDTYYTIR